MYMSATTPPVCCFNKERKEGKSFLLWSTRVDFEWQKKSEILENQNLQNKTNSNVSHILVSFQFHLIIRTIFIIYLRYLIDLVSFHNFFISSIFHSLTPGEVS